MQVRRLRMKAVQLLYAARGVKGTNVISHLRLQECPVSPEISERKQAVKVGGLTSLGDLSWGCDLRKQEKSHQSRKCKADLDLRSGAEGGGRRWRQMWGRVGRG